VECKRIAKNSGLLVGLLAPVTDGQQEAIPAHLDIAVTTPLRLSSAINDKSITLDSVQIIVLDEGDRLFDPEGGFLTQVDGILTACAHPQLQRCLFSATLPQQVEESARTVLNDPIRILVGQRNATVGTVKQKLIYAGSEAGKLQATLQELRTGGLPLPVMVFVQSKERVDQLVQELRIAGVHASALHSDMPQPKREHVVKRFRVGAIDVLVTTDLLSRGVDFKGVASVMNYDFPQSVVSYVHRIGRCGRAGRTGEAVTFFTDDDAWYLRSIANVMKISGCEVPDWMLKLRPPTKSEKKRLAKRAPFRKDISVVSGGEDLSKKRRRKFRLPETRASDETETKESNGESANQDDADDDDDL